MAKYSRIRDLREDADKTQQELADYLGTSTQHYGKYELGHAEIPFERAILLAKYYNVSLDYLAGLTNVKRPLPNYKLTEQELEFVKAMRSLDDSDKDKILKIVELISEHDMER